MNGQVNQQAIADRPVSSLLELVRTILLVADPDEKLNLNSWYKFLHVVFTPQTASCGPERWVSSSMKTMHYQRNRDTLVSRSDILAMVPICYWLFEV